MVHPPELLPRRTLPTASAPRRWHARVGVALTVVPLLLGTAGPAVAQDFTLIVHPGTPVGALSAEEASRLFLKKETRWPDGRLVMPVVLADERLVEAFCKRVHHRSAGAVRTYWYQMIFSGQDVPPPEKQTAKEVVDYVLATPGAIGFVPADTPLAGAQAVPLKK